eukprot:7200624-Pyramimonas_sp.AAC.1
MVSRNQARSSPLEYLLPEGGPTSNYIIRAIWSPSKMRNMRTRNGNASSGADSVVAALKEELKSVHESVVQRLYTEGSVDPWIVFWATCEPDSEGDFG